MVGPPAIDDVSGSGWSCSVAKPGGCTRTPEGSEERIGGLGAPDTGATREPGCTSSAAPNVTVRPAKSTVSVGQIQLRGTDAWPAWNMTASRSIGQGRGLKRRKSRPRWIRSGSFSFSDIPHATFRGGQLDRPGNACGRYWWTPWIAHQSVQMLTRPKGGRRLFHVV